MKNLVIVLFVVGLTGLGFSQNSKSEIKEVELEGVYLNLHYLEKVQDNTLSQNIISLENEASVFDVKKLAKFDSRKDYFQVLFKGTKGFIIADFDRDGKILRTTERYKDIDLPKNLIRRVLNQYPGSNFLKVVYTVDFDDQENVVKTYKIQIRDNGKKRNLKINPADNRNTLVTMNLKN